MRRLPTGTVTFLFTDIEGSTKLLHELGDRYADVLADHRRVIREAVAANEGVEVDTQGDAFFVAFERAADEWRLPLRRRRSSTAARCRCGWVFTRASRCSRKRGTWAWTCIEPRA